MIAGRIGGASDGANAQLLTGGEDTGGVKIGFEIAENMGSAFVGLAGERRAGTGKALAGAARIAAIGSAPENGAAREETLSIAVGED